MTSHRIWLNPISSKLMSSPLSFAYTCIARLSLKNSNICNFLKLQRRENPESVTWVPAIFDDPTLLASNSKDAKIPVRAGNSKFNNSSTSSTFPIYPFCKSGKHLLIWYHDLHSFLNHRRVPDRGKIVYFVSFPNFTIENTDTGMSPCLTVFQLFANVTDTFTFDASKKQLLQETWGPRLLESH